MMRTFMLAVIAFGVVTAAVPGRSDETQDLVLGKSGKAIADWVRAAGEKGFSGAVLAARSGKVVAALGVGHADLEGKIPIDPATLFEIASFSKQITAAAAVRLAEQKKLTLDDPIADHLPGVPKSCRSITLRHLLQHTSGIPGTNSQGHGDSLTAVLPTFLDGGPRHEPGSHWEYWNQGYALASEVIARAAGTSFVEYCRRELFRKAGMKSTGFTGDAAPRGATVAVGRARSGPPRSAFDHPYGDSYGFQYRGMGGVVTNVWDLWRWDRALDGKLLNTKSLAELFRPGLEDYALGWVVRPERGRLVQSHGGAVRGFVCEGRRYPEHDACVFVLSNDDADPVRVVATAVEQMLFGEEVTVVWPSEADAQEGAFLVGRYEDAEGSALTIEVVDATIRAQVAWTSGDVSRMTISKDATGRFAVFVNADRYDLTVIERTDSGARTLGLWGRTFQRDEG